MDNIIKILGILGISSIIFLITKWNIEKRKKRFERRQQLIDESRLEVISDEFQRYKFIKTPIFSKLKPHLSIDLIKELVKPPTHLVVEQVDEHYHELKDFRKEILEEIALLEMKWKLI